MRGALHALGDARAVQDRPGRAFRRSTNSEDNAGAHGRSGVRDSLCVEDRAPATPLSRSPANTHRKPKAATAHALAVRGPNLAVSLAGHIPGLIPEDARREMAAPSVDAPGRDEVVIASLAFLVPSGVPKSRTRSLRDAARGRPLVASRARAATGRDACGVSRSRGSGLSAERRAVCRVRGEGGNTSTRRRFWSAQTPD